MPAELTPDFPLFLGLMLAAICGAVAALVYVVALPGSPAVALAYGFGGLGLTFLAMGAVAAGILRALDGE
ncbi:hypothetical protein [Halosimplex pelagicum]|uniref:Uncharacterized protein n=1 Tax=Halosimplex pelagicum TaxID=869886 RepID=A0A7D5PEL4_9EURY|nr:hypothetical protein [Halosimplex pelagicum]QLH81699.1 hypothetical protein HZS54_08705 [Halosimplex pelagicum]